MALVAGAGRRCTYTVCTYTVCTYTVCTYISKAYLLISKATTGTGRFSNNPEQGNSLQPLGAWWLRAVRAT